MISKVFVVNGGVVLLMANALAAAQPQTAPAPMPPKIDAVVKELDKIDKPSWTKDLDLSSDRAGHLAFFGKADGLVSLLSHNEDPRCLFLCCHDQFLSGHIHILNDDARWLFDPAEWRIGYFGLG